MMKRGIPLLIVWIILIVFGLLAVYSVSVYESFTTSLKLTNIFPEPTNYFYFKQQLRSLGVSLLIVIFLWKIPVSFLKNHKFAFFFMWWAFLFQLLVFLPFESLVGDFNGARWWIRVAWIMTIQPVEIYKLAYVFFLSSRLVRKKTEINKPWFILFFIFICALIYVVLLFIPDFWSVLIMGGTALLMVRFAWLTLKKTFAIFLLWLWFWVFSAFTMYLINPDLEYIQNRFSAFFVKDDSNMQTIDWQNDQALIAIGGGGFFGQWLWRGLQKFGNIPEAQSDFIFAAFSEEIGFFWNCVLLSLYIFIFRYTIKQFAYFRDFHSKILAVGILSILMVQTFVHIGVNIQILPNTWVTLPFISCWWTSLMVSCAELVLLYKLIRSEDDSEDLPLKNRYEKLWK